MAALEKIIINKYFVLVLIIAILILLYLYNRAMQKLCPKRMSERENMANLLDTNELKISRVKVDDGTPHHESETDYRRVDIEDDDEESEDDTETAKETDSLRNDREFPSHWPQPLDDRPDLGNCICHQPDVREATRAKMQKMRSKRTRRTKRSARKPKRLLNDK